VFFLFTLDSSSLQIRPSHFFLTSSNIKKVVGHFFSFSKTFYSFLYSFCFAYKEERAKAPWFYRSDGLVTVGNVVGGRTEGTSCATVSNRTAALSGF
jgi:hypothetical protein